MSRAVSEAARGRAFVLAADSKGDKLQQWQAAIFNTFGAIDVRIRDDARFSGAIRRVRFSSLELTDVRSSSEWARRTRRHLTGDTQEAVALLFIRHGTIQLDQYGRRNLVGGGSFTLLDLNEAYDWVHARPAHVIGIKLPRHALANRVGDLPSHIGRARGAAAGIGRVTADFLESFASHVEGIPASAGAALERQFVDLAELLLTASDSAQPLPEMTPAEAIYARALSFIDDRLADADLSPDDVARAMPVSLRRLQAIFRCFGTSISETILSRRLALCHSRLVADPQSRIGELAYRAGFKSHAHFSTAFRAKYGCSPRDVQRPQRTMPARAH
jgi:AraC-like DNA-binding protein